MQAAQTTARHATPHAKPPTAQPMPADTPSATELLLDVLLEIEQNAHRHDPARVLELITEGRGYAGWLG